MQAVKRLEQQIDDHERLRVRLDVMRTRAKHLKEAHDLAKEKGVLDDAQVEALFDEMRKLQVGVAELKSTQHRMGEVIDAARKKGEEAEKLREQAKGVGALARAHHESAAVFAAARRRIGEGALSEIEEGANEILAECGVGVRVSASWSREGGDPAKNCPDCGSAMPASAKVKSCQLCGAERGRQVINELRVAVAPAGVEKC